MKNSGWFFGVLLMLGACLEDADCLRTADNALHISFKKLADGKADSLFIYNIAAAGADSIFYKQTPVDKLDTLTSATVTVNPMENETLFTFYFDGEEKIMRVGYKSETRFISDECGTEVQFYNLAVIETQFDSVRVLNPVLTNKKQTNIEIYH